MEARTAGRPFAQAISTPKEAGVGCGVSIKYDDRFASKAKAVFQKARYSSFSGFMRSAGGGYFYEKS